MRNLRTFAAIGLGVLALALAGCGGDDDEPSIQDIVNEIENTTTDGATLSKSEVIASGDAICAEGNAAINSLVTGADPAADAEQVRAITDGMRRDLRDLDAPSNGRSDLNDLIGAFGDQVDALEQRAATSRSGDDVGFQAAGAELEAARAAAQVAGEAYGFSSCGQPFDAVPDEDIDPDSGGTEPDPSVTPEPPPSEPPPSDGGGTGAPGGDDGVDDGGGGSSGSSGGISPG